MAKGFDFCAGRSPRFYELSMEICDCMSKADIQNKQENDRLITLLSKQVVIAENDAFQYAMKITSILLRLYCLKKDTKVPSEAEYEKLLSNAVDIMELAKSDKPKHQGS